MRSYLLLCGVWLAFAAACFAQPWLYPEIGPYTILKTDWSVGWLMLLFAAWNAGRWWSKRSAENAAHGNSDPET